MMHIKSNEPQYGIGYSEGMGWPDESGRGSGNSNGRGGCKSGYIDAGEDYATGNGNGAGYIGSCVANFLLENNYSVTIIDNLITGNIDFIPKRAKFEKCDIDDEIKISKIISVWTATQSMWWLAEL